MATATNIASSLEKRASVQASEGITPSDLNELVTAALAEHNFALTFATLPDNQTELVLLLAWIRLCYTRASKIVNDANLSGAAGFGQDRNTPFAKNMQLAASLRSQYDFLCDKLGLDPTPAASSVVVSSLRMADALLSGAPVPLSVAPVPPIPVLSVVGDISGTSLIIAWTFAPFEYFYSFILLNLIGTIDPIIKQEWNIISQSTVPRTSNLATVLFTLHDPRQLSLKLIDIDRSQVQRYMIVAKSKAEDYSYSNEISLPII